MACYSYLLLNEYVSIYVLPVSILHWLFEFHFPLSIFCCEILYFFLLVQSQKSLLVNSRKTINISFLCLSIFSLFLFSWFTSPSSHTYYFSYFFVFILDLYSRWLQPLFMLEIEHSWLLFIFLLLFSEKSIFFHKMFIFLLSKINWRWRTTWHTTCAS